MKNITYQFYNEGFATLFCLKPINYIKSKITNKTIINVLTVLIKLLYTIGIIGLIAILIYIKYC